MKTNLAEFIRNTPEGREADSILRACVHCGFCTATCPTYQLLGDELDGPRGRIYLIKELLEGNAYSVKTQLHLDRCLTCRACETTCPSGVQYGRLVDIGRNIVEKRVGRPFIEFLKRAALSAVIPNPALFGPLFRVVQLLRPLLPGALKRKVPRAVERNTVWPEPRHARRMLVLDGCVQPSLAPGINPATARVLDRLEISLVKAEAAGCCGAVTFHLNRQEDALDYMRRNIDAWWPHIEAGVEAVVMTASGCGTMVKEYGHLLASDPVYAEKARRISDMTRDISEIIAGEKDKLERFLSTSLFSLMFPLSAATGVKPRVAFHSPCSLQHGLQIRDKVESLLTVAGFEVISVPDSHLCCGSAGTYSILQPELSQKLLKNKVSALESGKPALLATANIGCLTHIQSGTALPVRHWIELLDERLKD
ncbi:MAG TPA: glycolate oxidase subunit GlcF [Burkholderiales bacterium]|jgi:glycolate oxidase iron-sulfur subunit|nr:glycolate oxidase subunit GlcF [Burkholderiales bacterium]